MVEYAATIVYLMPVVKYKSVMEELMEKPVFTPQDLRDRGIPSNYAKKLLHTLAKSGKITRIERGKYTSLNDVVAVAGHITEPCYLTLWTAMNIRNLTTQIPFSVEIATSRRRFNEKISFQDTPILFYTVPPRMMFGYEYIIWQEEIRVPVATPEKIVIDSLYFGKILEEEVLDIVNDTDKKRLRTYATLTKKQDIIDKTMELIERCSPGKK